MMSADCPKCGATNLFDETKKIPAYCSFCGAHLPDMTEYVKRSLNLGIDREYFKMDMQRADKNIEYVTRDTKRITKDIRRQNIKNIASVIGMIPKLFALFILLLGFIILFITVVKTY